MNIYMKHTRINTGAITVFNDFHRSSVLLNPIIFADKSLFETVDEELLKTTEWFSANKLSSNTDKTKYTFFINIS